MFLVALDQTVMSTASLSISQDFDNVAGQYWLISVYLMMSLITTPIYGRLSDSYGRRRIHLIGLVLFGLGSIFAALATSFSLIVAARGVQGLGAGALFSIAFALIADVVPLKERGRYTLFFVLIFGSASLLGPIFGGVIASQNSIFGISGWRWIFIFSIPIILLAIIQSAKYLPSISHKLTGAFDWLGATLFAGVIVTTLLIVQVSRNGNFDLQARSLMALLIAAFFGLFYAQKKQGENALFPITYFKNRAFVLTILTSAIASGAILIAMTVTALTIQIVDYRSPMVAGFTLLAIGFGNLFGSGYASRVFSKERSYRLFAAIGLLIIASGFLPMIFSSGIMAISIGLFFLGIGSGLINQFTSVMAPIALGSQHRGAGSAINTLFRALGGLLGVTFALALIFFQWKVPTGFTIPNLSAVQRLDFMTAVRPVYIASALIALAMAALAKFMPETNEQLDSSAKVDALLS
jgi:MFS family permease